MQTRRTTFANCAHVTTSVAGVPVHSVHVGGHVGSTADAFQPLLKLYFIWLGDATLRKLFSRLNDKNLESASVNKPLSVELSHLLLLSEFPNFSYSAMIS
uniref:Uncharacterized protein n=1 Tax=Setaria digitata TaxID=48799 RepID=A0A915Q169_9BILA